MSNRRRVMGDNLDKYFEIFDNSPYLTITALSGGVINFARGTGSSGTLYYNLDETGWITYTSGTNISVSKGSIIQFKGTLTPNNKSDLSQSDGIGRFTISFDCHLKGNCMSLIFNDNANTTDTIPYGYKRGFFELFKNNTTIKTISENFLPCTSINSSSSYMFEWMFLGCTSLTNTPELPIINLPVSCYSSMFYNCTSLINARPIRAKYFDTSSAYSMFSNCTSLKTPPEMDPYTISSSGCENMFYYCTSLSIAPNMSNATSLGCRMMFAYTALINPPSLSNVSEVYDQGGYQMFMNCTRLKSTPELPAMTLGAECYKEMFRGCTSLINNMSILPATSLKESCYYGMFEGCCYLSGAPELPATSLEESCYEAMFKNCQYNLTTAPELPAKYSAVNCYKEMFYNCNNLNYIKVSCKPYNYTTNWVYGVSSTGTFITTTNNFSNWTTGVNGIPEGWTVQTI